MAMHAHHLRGPNPARVTRRPTSEIGSWAAAHDPRWPQIAARLLWLKQQGRRAVRIVDADCGAGALLLHALVHARSLGFVAIEGRGIDASPALIGRARASASRCRDLAIGVQFEVADTLSALHDEQEHPADIVVGHGSNLQDSADATASMLRAAGDLVIGDGPCPWKVVA
jgi:SAM-dependent methyltransferase